MPIWQRVGLVVTLCALWALGPVTRAIAETVTVTIGVGDTILTVHGKTSPDAFVTIVNDGSVIGTTTAATDGTYSQTFPAQAPGIHELNVYAHSTNGYNTDTVTLSLNITEHATTTVEIFLPTTLLVDDTTLDPDKPLLLQGETYPSSTIKVFIDSNDFVTATADAQGNWSVEAPTNALTSGQHEFFVRATDGIGNQSYPTALRTFAVAARPDTSQPPTPTKPVEAPSVPQITFPQPDTTWDQPKITITGQAAPNVQIELWDGTRPIGSMWSDARGQWSIEITLESKEYLLKVRACLSGQCSDFSPIIIFTYTPQNLLSPLQQPLLIDLQPLTYTVIEGQPLIVRPEIVKGQPPYKTTTDWGDDKITNGTHVKDQLALTHHYAKPGKYTATFFAEDAQGRKGSIQFTIEVFPVGSTNWGPPTMIALSFSIALTVLLRIAYVRVLRGRTIHKDND